MRLPTSILVSVSLFTAETTAALYLSTTYRSDHFWQGLTLLFTLVPSVLVQLTLTFIHRELSQDRPLVLLLHILQLGPIVRSAPHPRARSLASNRQVEAVVTLLCVSAASHNNMSDWLGVLLFFPVNMSDLNACTSHNPKLLTGVTDTLRTCSCCCHPGLLSLLQCHLVWLLKGSYGGGSIDPC